MMEFKWKEYEELWEVGFGDTRHAKNLIEEIMYQAFIQAGIQDREEFSFEYYYFKKPMWRSHLVGNAKRKNIVFLVNNSFSTRDKDSETCGSQKFIVPDSSYSHIKEFVNYSGEPVAEIIIEDIELTFPKAQVSILFDIYKESNSEEYFVDVWTKIAKALAQAVKRGGISIQTLSEADNKEKYIEKISAVAQKIVLDKIDQDKRKIQQYDQQIADYNRNLLKAIRERELLWAHQKSAEDVEKELGSKLSKDIELIMEHEKIVDVLFKDNSLIIKTKPITIYAEGHPYYGGTFDIDINIVDGRVLFVGTEVEKRGYWSSHDAHPHVSGESGEACLGNVSSSLAEMLSQNELYALTMICLSFLESANIDDPAGGRIYNWDGIDVETGEIIPAERYKEITGISEHGEDDFECDICGEWTDEDDSHWVPHTLVLQGNYNYTLRNGEMHVCDHCRENSDRLEYNEDFDIVYYELEDERPVCEECGESVEETLIVYEWVEVDFEGIVLEYGNEMECCEVCAVEGAHQIESTGEWALEIREIEEEEEEDDFDVDKELEEVSVDDFI